MDFDSFATIKGYLSWPLYKLDALHVLLPLPPLTLELFPCPRSELTVFSFHKFTILQHLLIIIFLNAFSSIT